MPAEGESPRGRGGGGRGRVFTRGGKSSEKGFVKNRNYFVSICYYVEKLGFQVERDGCTQNV